jgi:MFS family permease
MRLPEALSALENRHFRIYWLGQAVSLVGTWMQQMAQGWVVTRLTPSATALGALAIAGSVPMAIFGFKGGQLADRLSKRNILIVTQIAMMLLALAFAGLAFTGEIELWHVFLLAILLGAAAGFDLPASQSLAPELVEPRQIARAVAMMQAAFHGSRLIGPALAGILIQRFGEGSAFLANAASFVAVIASLAMIPARPARFDENAAKTDRSLGAGFRYVKTDALAKGLMLLLLLSMIFSFPFNVVLMVYYARHELLTDAAGMGTLMSATGFGALAGASLMVFATPSSWPTRLLIGLAACAASLIGLAVTAQLFAAVILVTSLSFGTSLYLGTITQTVQSRVPDALRGRVMALFGMAFTSVLPISGLLLALLADAIGLRRVLVLSAVAFVALALPIWWKTWRAARELVDAPT